MTFTRPSRCPEWLITALLSNPEILRTCGKRAYTFMKDMRERARQKGKEHKRFLNV